MTIAILVPTKGRPDQLRRMVKSVARTAANPVYILIAPTYASDISLPDISEKTRISAYDLPDLLPTVQKWNYLADIAMMIEDVKLFMLGADDMYFDTPGWDTALLDHYNSLENKIHAYALQDSRDRDGTPHVCVSREYINAMGYFIPPIYLHWNVDTWTVAIAKANNCFKHFKNFSLVHSKPSDFGKPDETHSRIRDWGWRYRDAYVEKTCGHFLEVEKQRLARFFQ